jgi:hypothetical protein
MYIGARIFKGMPYQPCVEMDSCADSYICNRTRRWLSRR